ncbi:MAG: hypothetical protein AAF517_28335 [Planctomycetota bacterium]
MKKLAGVVWTSLAIFSAGCEPPDSDDGPIEARLPARPQTLFLSPVDGDCRVAPRAAFRWRAVPGATSYQLRLGTTPGGSEVLESGLLESSTTSYQPVVDLPRGTAIFARLRVHGVPGVRYSSVRFQVGGEVVPAQLVSPGTGIDVQLNSSFRWSTVPLARAYRLRLGTSAGASDVFDGEWTVLNERFIFDLPKRTRLFGVVETLVGSETYRMPFDLTVASVAISSRSQVKSAIGLAKTVRQMADFQNDTFSYSKLRSFSPTRAPCSHYTSTFLSLVSSLGLNIDVRRRGVCFLSNGSDCHTLSEVYDTEAKHWVLVDPTFALVVKQRDGSEYLSVDELSALARERRFDEIQFECLLPYSEAALRSYYIDYPLLFLNSSDVVSTSVSTR